jgi:hypothetical protein
LEEASTAQTKEEIAHSLRAMYVGALITLRSFACTDQKKDLCCFCPVVCHDVGEKNDGSKPESTGTQ